MTITEFLTARYDEDEWDARPFTNELGTSRPWTAAEVGGVVDNGPNPLGGLDGVVATATTHMAAVHIARHDPARVLADIAAKRAIVEAHPWEYADPYESWKDDAYRERYGDTRGNRNCKTCGGTASHPNFPAGVERRDSWPCMTLRLLAQPYAEHPDFDESWKP